MDRAAMLTILTQWNNNTSRRIKDVQLLLMADDWAKRLERRGIKEKTVMAVYDHFVENYDKIPSFNVFLDKCLEFKTTTQPTPQALEYQEQCPPKLRERNKAWLKKLFAIFDEPDSAKRKAMSEQLQAEIDEWFRGNRL